MSACVSPVRSRLSPSSTWLLAALLLAFVPALRARSSVPGQPVQATPAAKRQPLPLDPLTLQERKLAEEIALRDGRVKELLGEAPHRLMSAELLFLKPDGEITPASPRPVKIDRNVEVLFRRSDESGVRAVVNLSRRSVTSAERLESAQVPLIPEDITEAAKLALENQELRRALGDDLKGYAAAAESRGAAKDRYAITALRLFTSAEDDPCAKHRCVRLMFRRGRDYLGQPIVWVDLTARKAYVERREP